MNNEVLLILKKNHLSVTDSRQKILELFLHSNGALEHADIEKKTGESFDRVTVYRTLQLFVEKGLIHLIPTTDNAIKYALCKEECQAGHHHDDHVHFICDSCGQNHLPRRCNNSAGETAQRFYAKPCPNGGERSLWRL